MSAIVNAYIRTGEPVGSKTLVELLGNGVSSATIRNDMAELAAKGFLEQPHTSAGRIPTAKAFRLYVDTLMPRTALSESERAAFDTALEMAAGDPDRLMEQASALLAQQTGCAAVAATSNQQGASIRRIELMCAGARTAAVLLMTDGGGLRSRVCRLDTACDIQVLAQLSEALNAEFAGKPLSAVGMAQVQRLVLQLGIHGLSYAPVLTAFAELVRECTEADIRLSGQLNLLQHPDYQLDRARALLSFLSRRELLAGMMTAPAGELCVVLGSESPRPELYGSSVIVTRYAVGENNEGTLGLIGPLRMDYAQAIPRLQYVAQTVSRLLAAMME